MKILVRFGLALSLLLSVCAAHAQNYPLNAGGAYGGYVGGDSIGAHLFGTHNRAGRLTTGIISGVAGYIFADRAQNRARHQRQDQRQQYQREQQPEYVQRQYSETVRRTYSVRQPVGCPQVTQRQYQDCNGNFVTETITTQAYTTQTYVQR